MKNTRKRYHKIFLLLATITLVFGSLMGSLTIYRYEKDQQTHGNLFRMEDSPTILEFQDQISKQILNFGQEYECSYFFENIFFALVQRRYNDDSISLLRVDLGKDLTSITSETVITLIENSSGWYFQGLISNGTHIWFLAAPHGQDYSDPWTYQYWILGYSISGELMVNKTIPFPQDYDFASNHIIRREWIGIVGNDVWIRERISKYYKTVGESHTNYVSIVQRYGIFDISDWTLKDTREDIIPRNQSSADIINFELNNVWWECYTDPYDSFDGIMKWDLQESDPYLIQYPISGEENYLPKIFVRTGEKYSKPGDLEESNRWAGMSRIFGNRSFRLFQDKTDREVEGIIIDRWEPIPYPVEEVFTMCVGIGIFAFACIIIIINQKRETPINLQDEMKRPISQLESQQS